MRALLLATIASMGLVGCVGELDGGMDGGGGDGHGRRAVPTRTRTPDWRKPSKMFDDNVYPIISREVPPAARAATARLALAGN